MREARRDPWLIAILGVTLLLGSWQLDWGLPAAEHSWVVDGLEPVTVLGIVKQSFHSWNSGWFYFKYPPAYPLLIGAAYAPYLGYLAGTGQWSRPKSEYPYGFKDPESALLTLSRLGRLLSVLFTLGAVGAAYSLARRVYGTQGARIGAFLVATCYPVVFYAHTMNVDASYLCWLMVALAAAVASSETDRAWVWAILGASAALAVSTKEQAFGMLLPLPFLAVGARLREHGIKALWSRPILAMALSAVAVAAVANNAIYNPLGVIARIAYLMGRPLTPVDAPLKPVAFSLFKGSFELVLLKQFWDGLDAALGTPLLWVAMAGAVTALRRPRAAAWLLLPAFSYYYLSLRGQQLITMRYSLPFVLVGALLAGGFLGELWPRARGGVQRAAIGGAVAAMLALSLARGVELDLLLRNDSRYQAEAWMRAAFAAGARGEVYQKQTFLPRPPAGMTVSTVPMGERSIEAFTRRNPDFVVLSSSSRQSIWKRWNPDWRTTGEMLESAPAARTFLTALEAEKLPYRRAATFRQQPRLLRMRITGLCPEIRVYKRVAS